MTKMNCLIIDDEPLAHQVIIEYAKELPYLEIVAQAYLPLKALEILKTQDIDLIFLDIEMPKLNGLEMLKLSRTTAEVIITSAYEQYALKGYEHQVCDYLLKPFRLDRFVQATEKALQQHQLKSTANQSDSHSLFIKVDKRLIQVAIEDIHYIESYGNYVKIWTGSFFLLTAGTLSRFEEELADKQFCRIHKSYLINTRQIDYLEGNQLMMKNQVSLLVSKNFKQDFLLQVRRTGK